MKSASVKNSPFNTQKASLSIFKRPKSSTGYSDFRKYQNDIPKVGVGNDYLYSHGLISSKQ